MKKIIYICMLITAFSACKKDSVFDTSPSQRTKENIASLRKELTEAPYGWKVTYFPKTDSLLFSNPSEVLEKDINYRSRYGYGGAYFLMKFDDNGNVKMLADYTDTSAQQVKESQFEVKQNTYAQLSFTTYNYLHELVNDKYNASSDFLYAGRDINRPELLVFKTASYNSPAKEYIVLEKLKASEDWNQFTQTALTNRQFFENMPNPQLVIRKGGRIYFKSDVQGIKNDTDANRNFVREIRYKRFYVFQVIKKRHFDPNITDPVERTGLGSGYCGTEEGLSFRAGLRYNKNYIFYDFKREGNKFVCELVIKYDSIRKRNVYVSKHLYPQGEPTGFVAEIYNE